MIKDDSCIKDCLKVIDKYLGSNKVEVNDKTVIDSLSSKYDENLILNSLIVMSRENYINGFIVDEISDAQNSGGLSIGPITGITSLGYEIINN
ncbi:hypothetical protein [Apilactobacillus xinyiensis]|uniref:hypothetical protein n=1 Tax=Apilactobacillus xinyiensis TaxID=2841032 RepID=UPI00201014A6|nr:hypothetical protein [Apilactobacillus xinyiensis]MCL0330566.1 hypothetical protein [Apilactobacillus xinyiensis]